MSKYGGLMKSSVSEALMYILTKRTIKSGGIPELVRFEHTPWGAFLNFYRWDCLDLEDFKSTF